MFIEAFVMILDVTYIIVKQSPFVHVLCQQMEGLEGNSLCWYLEWVSKGGWQLSVFYRKF